MLTRPNVTHAWQTFVVLLVCVGGALVCLWSAWCEFPTLAWNDTRLAPAFALRHGVSPYPGLDQGPLSTWIYGPVGILMNLPATFARNIAGALQAACAINLVLLIAPTALVLINVLSSVSGWARATLGIAVATLLIPHNELIVMVADHSATAFGILSCWCLAKSAKPSRAQCVTAAALVALAVWSKQLSIAIVPAQMIFLWSSASRGLALEYIAWTASFGALGLLIFGGIFGFPELWLNLVSIPGRLPWSELWAHAAPRTLPLFAQLVVPTLILIALWRSGNWPTRASAAGRYFQISVLVAAFMLPLGLAAFFKIGGDLNVLHSWPYLLPACLAVWLCGQVAPRVGDVARIATVGAVALLVSARQFRSVPAHPFTDHLATAKNVVATYSSVWFPQHPVLQFYLEGTLSHTEDGILTRNLAGIGLREQTFRRHLPSNLQAIAYLPGTESPPLLSLLPEYSHTVRAPYWNVHVRPSASSPTVP